MSFEPREYVRHILVETDFLLSHRNGVTFEIFVADETLRRAVVRSLEIIGEAAKRVPSEFSCTIPPRRVAGHGRYARSFDSQLLRRRLGAGLGCSSEPYSRT